jgi:hypothetical protein
MFVAVSFSLWRRPAWLRTKNPWLLIGREQLRPLGLTLPRILNLLPWTRAKETTAASRLSSRRARETVATVRVQWTLAKGTTVTNLRQSTRAQEKTVMMKNPPKRAKETTATSLR